ncbi:MAG: glycosyltransferase family 2 protein [Planctomycetota bacterium]
MSAARAEAREELPALSLVVPVHNEEANLAALHARIAESLPSSLPWELLLVDDASTDGSTQRIAGLAATDHRVIGVFLSQRGGQTAALVAGIQRARARLLATLDADLQNDPADLPGMLAALPGHDAVVGWRRRRHDNFLRRLSSRVAQRTHNLVLGESVQDTGCSLKLFRTEALRALPLTAGMHRFLPALLRLHGFKVLEHPVSHQPRRAGRSKYGVLNRLGPALRGLWTVARLRRQLKAARPAGSPAAEMAGRAAGNPRAATATGAAKPVPVAAESSEAAALADLGRAVPLASDRGPRAPRAAPANRVSEAGSGEAAGRAEEPSRG